MDHRIYRILWRACRLGGWLGRLPLPARARTAMNNWIFNHAPLGLWLPASYGKRMRRLGPNQWELAARVEGGLLRLREN